MTWRLATCVFVIVLASGCRGPGIGIDPFGRTRIPPPPTGAVSQSNAGDPYYGGISRAPALVPLDRSISGKTSSTAPTPLSSRAAGWTSASNNAESASASGRLRPVPSNLGGFDNASSVSLTSGDPASWKEHPAARAGFQETTSNGATRTSSTPRTHRVQFVTGDNTDRTDIAELPETTTATRGQITTSRLPEHTVDTGSGRYGRASDYTWLKGRLEYSASQRQWKLRYISLDQETDRLGGSVLLPALTELENYRTGAFVHVRGQLTATTADARAVPRYSVTRLSRQN